MPEFPITCTQISKFVSLCTTSMDTRGFLLYHQLHLEWGLMEIGEDLSKSSWVPYFRLTAVSEVVHIQSHVNTTTIHWAFQYSQFKEGFLADICVNINSHVASAPTLSPCIFLPPNKQALLVYKLLVNTVPRQAHTGAQGSQNRLGGSTFTQVIY